MTALPHNESPLGSDTPSAVDVQVWPVAKLVAAIRGDGSERIFIPSFQRSFVWKEKKQNALIATIKNSLPIGALLFYDDGIKNGKRQYQIVDGLQRATTLINYENDVFRTFAPDEVDEQLLTDLLDGLDIACDSAADRNVAEKKARNAIAGWVRSRQSFVAREGFRGSALLQAVATKFGLVEGTLSPVAVRLCEEYVEALRERLEIGDYKMPIVVFSGDKALLPQIFEQLNNTGVKLNKFDILASSWDGKFVTADLPELRSAIDRRLSELGKESIARDLGPKLRHRVELFHAVCGSGMVMAERAPSLFLTKKSWKISEPLPCAFNVTALSFTASLSSMDTVPAAIDRFGTSDDYFKAVFEAVDEVDEALRPLTAGTFADSTMTQPHTELQIASIVASIFRARAGRSDGQYRSQAERAKFLRQNYLYDALRREWSGTGDTKALKAVHQDRYMYPVNREAFKTAAYAWQEEHLDAMVRLRERESWIDFATLAFLRAYLFASDVPLSERSGVVRTQAVVPGIAAVVGNRARVAANVRMLDDSGHVLCDPVSAIGAPSPTADAAELRGYLRNAFNAMLDKIVLKFGFMPQA